MAGDGAANTYKQESQNSPADTTPSGSLAPAVPRSLSQCFLDSKF
jgi:hypothetical protein